MFRLSMTRHIVRMTSIERVAQLKVNASRMFFASSAKKSPPTPKPPKPKQPKQAQQQQQARHQIPQELDPELLKGTERIDADSVTLNASIDEILQKEPDFLHWFVQVYVPAVAESVGDVENDDSFDADKFVSDGYQQWTAAGKPRISTPKIAQ
jgi:hypothetical protein